MTPVPVKSAAYRQGVLDRKRTTSAPVSVESMFATHASTTIEFPVVVKADVQGSVEAIVHALNGLSTDEIKVRILNSGVGAITESDVTLASASGGRSSASTSGPMPRRAKLRSAPRSNSVIMMSSITSPTGPRVPWRASLVRKSSRRSSGRARVQEVFPAGKRDKAAGLLVLEGVIRKGLNARLTREDVIVSKTTISSLRRFKDDVAEVVAGTECGVLLADTNDIKPGDNLEVFEVEERARTL